MEFIEYIRQKKKMTNCCKIPCSVCPLGDSDADKGCVFFETRSPEKAEKTVSDWAEAHPEKTRAERFFEAFPNAPKNKNGDPELCIYSAGYLKKKRCIDLINGDCHKCWSRPANEQEP